MKNQNLNVTIDLTLISQAIQAGHIQPHSYNDKSGVEHKTVTLLVTEAQNQTDRRTHTVRIKAHNSWNGVKDENGKTLYFGDATPSKYQPENSNAEQPAKKTASDNPLEDLW